MAEEAQLALDFAVGELQVKLDREGGALVFRLHGELDLASAPRLASELATAATREDRVVIDLRGLEFIDSSGLHVLLAANRRCAQDGCALSLLRGPRQVERVLEITGTLRAFRFDD